MHRESNHPLLFQERQTPHTNLDMITADHRIRGEGLHPPIPSEAPEHIQQLLKDCWQLSPSQRPSFEKICPRIQLWNAKIMSVMEGSELNTYPANSTPPEYGNCLEDTYALSQF